MKSSEELKFAKWKENDECLRPFSTDNTEGAQTEKRGELVNEEKFIVRRLNNYYDIWNQHDSIAGYEYTGCRDIDGNCAERLGYWEKDTIGWRWLHGGWNLSNISVICTL